MDIYRLNICNLQTRCKLGHRGYADLGSYLACNIIDKYYDSNSKLKSNFNKEEFKEWFTIELNAAIIETNKRISIKNKKKKVADKINDIESEIDLKIYSLVEDWAEKGIKMTLTDKKCLPNSVSKEYNIDKKLDGYGSFRRPKNENKKRCKW